MLLLIVKSVFSLIALVILTTVIHEGAHYLVATILKVPIASFTWFDPRYSAPVFVSGSTEYTLGMEVVSYAGGLVTGVLLLATLVFKREWFRQSLYRWFLGFYIATFGFWEICQGVLEGVFHEMYIADVTNILSLSYCVGYASAFLGMALYWVFMPGIRCLISKSISRSIFIHCDGIKYPLLIRYIYFPQTRYNLNGDSNKQQESTQ